MSLVRLRNGWRICLHWSKSPVPRRWSLCVEGPISSCRSEGKQGSRRGDSAVSPICSPKSLKKSVIQCKKNKGQKKKKKNQSSYHIYMWVSLVSHGCISNENLFISLSCCISSKTQEGGHINTINVLCAMCVTSQVELGQ